MNKLTSNDLASVSGGQAVKACYEPGKGPQQPVWENIRTSTGAIAKTPDQVREATKSTSERVMEATDKAILPWEIFNGVFGAFGPEGS